MKRRSYLRHVVAGTGAAALAGCAADRTGDAAQTTTDSGDDAGPLRVATYPAFVDAPSTSPGAWVKENFESETGHSMQWFVPDAELSYFIQRRQQGVTIDADLYIGLTPDNLVRVDSALGDTQLFETVDEADVPNASGIREEYRFDPQGRALPFDTSYISLVYDGTSVDNPGTFDALASDAYRGDLITPSPQQSETGLGFMLWTVDRFGEDGYLDYWSNLVDNGARILGSWNDAYGAWSNGEAPIVVSFATDQVFADRFDEPLEEHQVGFLDGQGYAYLEGMAPFAGTDRPEAAREFMNFILDPEVQSEIAQRNVAFPAVENVDLPADFDDLTYTPDETVSYGYGELAGNLDGWLESWSQRIASN